MEQRIFFFCDKLCSPISGDTITKLNEILQDIQREYSLIKMFYAVMLIINLLKVS